MFERLKAMLETRRQRSLAMRSAADAWANMFTKGMERHMIRGQVTDPYAQMSTVYKAVRAIASRGSSVSFSIFRNDERVEDHPLYNLMANPNSYTHGRAWLEKILVYLELCGESFWLKDRDARDAPAGPAYPRRLRFLIPTGMKEIVDKDEDELTGWKYTREGRQTIYAADEIIHIPYVDPWNPYRGLAPLSAAMLGVTIGWKGRKWQERFLTNGGMPAFYATWPKDVIVGETQRERLETDFTNRYLGLDRVGKPAFMFQGGELKSISPNQKEMDWLGGLNAMDVDILGCFNVPPPIVGILDQANYSNMREAKRYMLYATVFPKLDLIGSVLQSTLVDVYWPGDEWRWDKDAKVAEEIPEDIQDKIGSTKLLWSMGVPFDEAAKMVGLDADVTDKAWLETGWLPLNLRDAGDDSDGEPDAIAPAPKPDPEVVDPDAPIVDDAKTLYRARALGKILEEKREPLAKQYVVPLKAWYLGLRKEVLTKLANADTVPDEPKGYGTLHHTLVKDALRPDADVEEFLFGYDEAAEKLILISEPNWEAAMESGGVTLMAELGGDQVFEIDTTELQNLLADKRMRISVDGQIVGAINERVRRVISAGIAARSSVLKVAADVRVVFNGARKNALDIARTEMGQTFNMGRFDGMRQAGIKKHRWVTADAAARESHDKNQQQGVQNVGTRFSNGLLYPGDPSTGDAGEVVNCRCNTVAEF